MSLTFTLRKKNSVYSGCASLICLFMPNTIYHNECLLHGLFVPGKHEQVLSGKAIWLEQTNWSYKLLPHTHTLHPKRPNKIPPGLRTQINLGGFYGFVFWFFFFGVGFLVWLVGSFFLTEEMKNEDIWVFPVEVPWTSQQWFCFHLPDTNFRVRSALKSSWSEFNPFSLPTHTPEEKEKISSIRNEKT